ncbi:MAG: ATP-binding cassette domain-containing protein, partial [Pseudomonadota bacterium]
RPLSGEVHVNNNPLPLKGHSPVQLIWQHPELSVNPRWRIRQILEEGNLSGQDMMTELGLDKGYLNRFPHEMSGGELQRIAIARALGPKTRYLIADEITAMLDAVTQAQIWHMILRHAKGNNIGVLVISHNMKLLNRICDSRINMHALLIAK